MDRATFDQARQFIFSDVERELQLAGAPPEALQALGVLPGGGNFLAAMGLLCYTEFAGKLMFGHTNAGRDVASANFNSFFALLGTGYADLLHRHNIYNVFRCGLAHEYYVKHACTIVMRAETGIRELPGGAFVFVVAD